eukprot:UN06865
MFNVDVNNELYCSVVMRLMFVWNGNNHMAVLRERIDLPDLATNEFHDLSECLLEDQTSYEIVLDENYIGLNT